VTVDAPRIAVLMWPDAFEDWYGPLGIDREAYLETYDAEWVVPAAAALRGAGASVHIVHGTHGAAGQGVQRSSGAVVHFVPVSPVYRGLRQAIWGHRYYERVEWAWALAPLVSTLWPPLLRALVGLRADAVVIQDYETPRFDVAAPVLAACGLRVVGLDTGASSNPSRAPWKAWTARRAQALLAVNEAEARRARSKLRHPCVATWPPPLRPETFVSADRAGARERLGVDADARIVLAVGRLHPVKGLSDLAEACAPLDCELVLVGSGAEEGRLRARGQANLRLTGRIETSELADWYAAANVVALASLHEGFPLTVLEALAAGRGVVATTVGGVPDVVRDGETGWLVPPRDVRALRSAIAAALADVGEADRRGAAGRDGVIARYAPEPAGRELLRLILGH